MQFNPDIYIKDESHDDFYLKAQSADLGLNDPQFELSQQNIDMLDDFPIQSRYLASAADSFSDGSSPSTNNSHTIQVDPAIHKTALSTEVSRKPKTKKQLLEEQDAILLAKDDSELTDEELQMKRKAQNRAAQRAFRERKETKMKELENKLTQSEEDKKALLEELKQIRKQTLAMQTENEILKKSLHGAPANLGQFEFPTSESDFITQILERAPNHTFNPDTANKVYDSPENGSKVLALGAVWDYLMYRIEQENLDVDVAEVMARLKGNEKCHGYGPAYPVVLLDKVIAECTR